MFIEIVSLDLLFPLTEEMWTLIKHLTSYGHQRKKPEKTIKLGNPEKNGDSKCASFFRKFKLETTPCICQKLHLRSLCRLDEVTKCSGTFHAQLKQRGTFSSMRVSHSKLFSTRQSQDTEMTEEDRRAC